MCKQCSNGAAAGMRQESSGNNSFRILASTNAAPFDFSFKRVVAPPAVHRLNLNSTRMAALGVIGILLQCVLVYVQQATGVSGEHLGCQWCCASGFGAADPFTLSFLLPCVLCSRRGRGRKLANGEDGPTLFTPVPPPSQSPSLPASVLPDQRAWPCPYPLQPCPQNCQACDENGRCLQCQQGTGLNTRHQCVPCVDRLCVQCLGNYKRCTQCMSTGAGLLDHYPNAKGECRRVRDNAASSVTATGPAAKEANWGPAASHLAQCNMPFMQAWCASLAAVRGGRLRLVSWLHNAGAVQSLPARLHA